MKRSQLFPFESKFIDIGAQKIHYIDEGDGPLVVLLPGAPTTLFIYKRLIELLQDDYRVVAMDFPGFGLSETPEKPYSLADYSESLEKFFEKMDLQDATLLINDTAGCIGVFACRNIKDRVTNMIYMSTIVFPLTGKAWVVKFMLRFIVSSWPFRLINRQFNVLPCMVSTVAPFRNPLPKEERRYQLSLFNKPQRDRVISILSQLGRQDDFLAACERIVQGPLAHKPSLLIYGSGDPVRRVGGTNRIAALIHAPEVKIIPHEEHFPMISSAQEVATTIKSWMTENGKNAQLYN